MTSFLLPFACLLLLILCSRFAYGVGFHAGREQGMSDVYHLVTMDKARPSLKGVQDNISGSVAIGSTIFAFAASAFLFLLPAQPIDRSLHGEFRRWQGNAYVIVVKYPLNRLREARLYEDDKLLGPANSDPQKIWAQGSGLYRLYKEADELAPILMFSASDNTDPNTNGRKYRLE
ncbi:hypothetical protein [Bradyrhizobium mercantei]|uniref:hypothetical protein n=1 Tax=Bradyrhizobium mercantei TaxID=1904807 RepID=UPI001FDA4E19|nr:hypothetical protein [Bradyrhizobium mercantei]